MTAGAGRVLGCLIEKQLTTPQQYPLTANALTLACNQATNRDPVVTLDEETVLAAIDELRGMRLVRVVLPSHGRSVNRYRHVVDEIYSLDVRGNPLLAVLLLRGPQTVGELRARTERMVDFPTVDVVQDQLEALAAHPDGLVRLLPRRPGQKEDRWQQTLAQPWADGTSTDGTSIDGVRIDTFPSDTFPSDSFPVDRDVQALAASGDTGGAGSSGISGDGSATPPPADHRSDVEALRAEVSALQSSLAAVEASLDELRRSLGG